MSTAPSAITPEPRPCWLTTTEAAELLGVSSRTVWRWARSGSIPRPSMMSIGNRVRVARTWVEGATAGGLP